MNRHSVFAFCAIAFLFCLPRVTLAADTFVIGFEDLPLMIGLAQVQQDSVLFDTPQGRIVQASATGTVTRNAVLSFYSSTLPQLGWVSVDQATFQREGETLRIEFTQTDRLLTVHFLAEPSATGLR